ncbi:MAG: MXAN_2562 family outer membrane beta-barrel protein [Polyangiaceae bacterium]|nr:MXAN_2562 family outer membrane beta-barrel protein [Polyangiaceae bacterium]
MTFSAIVLQRAASLAAVAVLMAVAAPASAQGFDAAQRYTWHRSDSKRLESPQNHALEIRVGPYPPKIDEEFGDSKGPYEQVFGNDKRVYMAKAMFAEPDEDGNRVPSAEPTSLWIMPMYVVGVARVDVLARELGIPLVPYVKAGVGYALWKTSDGSGTSKVPTDNPETKDKVETTEGKGHSYGLHFAPGIMLMLDWFDERSARRLDNFVGVNHSYL